MRSLPVLSLQARGHELAAPPAQMAALARSGVPAFEDVLARHGRGPLEAHAIEVLQVNVGKLCNQTCAHCHVDAGPDRREVMSRETAEQVVELLRRHPDIPTLDITGRRPRAEPAVPVPRGRGRRARSPRDRSLQPLGAAPPLAARPRGLPRRAPGGGDGLASLLPRLRHRRPARRRRLREEPRRPAPPERGRLREGRGPRPEPRPQPGRHVPARRPGLARARLQARAAAAARDRLRPPVHDHQHADQPLPRSPRADGQPAALHGPARRLVQPAGGRRRHVPDVPVGRLGRHALRLRLQPDARDAHQPRGAADALRPARARSRAVPVGS